MSIVWAVIEFVVCLFMPASVQMMVKDAITAIYKKITGKTKDIAW